MSYDLYLLRRNAVGDDPAAAYERLEELEERQPTAAEEAELRRLVTDLQAVNPRLDVSESQTAFNLQLGYENEQPAVIDIGVDEITMSWSYGADDVAAALKEVERYLPVFEQHGYVAYDPQLGRLFDPGRDRGDTAEVHADTRDRVFETFGASSGERPWWKRMLGLH